MRLPTPVGRQREVLYLPPRGHVAVLGTAGSGKTTLAILRAAHLADPATNHGGKTLLVTFNRALVTYLNSLRDDELADVVIENYHKFARGYLAAKGRLPYGSICNDARRRTLINRAVREVASRRQEESLFRRTPQYFFDEISWLAQHGISLSSGYTELDRSGTPVEGTCRALERELLLEVYDEYRRQRAVDGKIYDWDDLATAVCEELANDDSPRRYRHLVIDEGQDFSPEMIRSLTLAVPSDGTVTFFADVAQQIYGHRVSWRSAGLRIDQPWEFRENYRNTRQIAGLALAISQMPYYQGIADLVEPVTPVADGPLPTLVSFSTAQSEVQFVADQAKRMSRTQSVAILVRNRRDEGLFLPHLPQAAVRLHRNMSSWQAGPGIRYGTYHSAKGLEFDSVILPRLSSAHLPDPISVTGYGEQEAAVQDGRLLYVGVTRAKVRLILTFTGQRTDLLPTGPNLYAEVVR